MLVRVFFVLFPIGDFEQNLAQVFRLFGNIPLYAFLRGSKVQWEYTPKSNGNTFFSKKTDVFPPYFAYKNPRYQLDSGFTYNTRLPVFISWEMHYFL